MIKGGLAHLPHTNKWIKLVCAPQQKDLKPMCTCHKNRWCTNSQCAQKLKEIHDTLKTQNLRGAARKCCSQDLCPLIAQIYRLHDEPRTGSGFVFLIHYHSQLIQAKHMHTNTKTHLLYPYTPLSQQLLPAAPNCGCQIHQNT